MKAYQVYSGEENKHGFQIYNLQATYLNKDKALEHYNKIKDETPLNGDVFEEYVDSKGNRSWLAKGWDIITIAYFEEIDIIC